MDRALRGRWGRDLGESLHVVVALVGLVEARLYPVFEGGTGTCIPSMRALGNFSYFEPCYAAAGGQLWFIFRFLYLLLFLCLILFLFPSLSLSLSFTLQTHDMQQWPN